MNRFFLFLIFCFLSFKVFSASPYVVIEEKAREVMQILQKTNVDVEREVLAKADDLFDFERMTALAVGQGWVKATDAQKKELQSLFKRLLINTYINIVSKLKEAEIQVDKNVKTQGKQATVRTLVKNQGKTFQIDYTLYENNGNYKVFNVVVSGASLVTVYRNEFGRIISTSGIEGLISNLKSRV